MNWVWKGAASASAGTVRYARVFAAFEVCGRRKCKQMHQLNFSAVSAGFTFAVPVLFVVLQRLLFEVLPRTTPALDVLT